jgi:hypothetical protein
MSRAMSRLKRAGLLSLTDSLNAAEQLPDDKRREAAAALRHAAEHDPTLELDEREEKRWLADRIEAMCSTPAPAPATQAAPVQASSEKTIGTSLATRFLNDLLVTLGAGGERKADVRHDVWEQLCLMTDSMPDDKLREFLVELKNEIQITSAKSPREEAIFALLDEMIEIPEGGRRGIQPDVVPDNPAKALGDRSKRTDDFGDGGFMPRKSASDRKDIGGRASALDHTKAGKKRRAEAAKLVRRIDPATVTIQQPRRHPWEPLDVPHPKHALPFEAEAKPVNPDPFKESPLSPEERKRRKAKAERRAAEDAVQTQRDNRANRGLPPLTAEEEAAILAFELAPGVGHEDDPEF